MPEHMPPKQPDRRPSDDVGEVLARHRALCGNMAEGFCIVEVLFDDAGRPHDYRFLEVNDSFERQTGLSGATGRRVRELSPLHEQHWFDVYGAVANTGRPARFEQRAEGLGRWYEVYAFPTGEPGAHHVGILFNDITQRKLDELMAISVVEYAIIMLDAQGRIRSWNAGAERIKGYAREEILGQHFSVFYPPEDRATGKPARVLATAAATGRFDDEGWRVRRDGSRFWASVAVTPMRDSDGKLQGYCKVTRDLSERKRGEEALRAEVALRERAQQQLHELNATLESQVVSRTQELTRANAQLVDAKQRLEDLSARLIDSQEQERGHIARELHDETGQILTLLRMRLSDLSKAPGGEGVEACMGLVNQVVEHTRRLARNLRPTILDDLGLHDALEWMLQQQAQLAGWSAAFSGGDSEERFAPHLETACFRIAQEALTNAARYAHATHVSVALAAEAGRLVLSVKDNGRGFDLARALSPAERSNHFGLVSMSERAKLVGARLSIESEPGRGTQVECVFPIPRPD